MIRKVSSLQRSGKFRSLKYLSIALLLIAVVLYFKNFFILLLFVVIAPLPQLYRRVVPVALGLELITFSTVLIIFWQGAFVAWILSFPMIVLGMMYDGRHFHKFTVIKYTALCLFAFIFKLLGVGIVGTGIICVIIANIIVESVAYITWVDPFEKIPGMIINIILNIFLFLYFAEGMLGLLV